MYRIHRSVCSLRGSERLESGTGILVHRNLINHSGRPTPHLIGLPVRPSPVQLCHSGVYFNPSRRSHVD